MFKKAFKCFLYFIIFIILLLFSTEFFTDIFKFPEPTHFKGSKLYNPYQGIDSTLNNWKLANFHSHTRSWMGLTNGSKVLPADVNKSYHHIGYNIVQISDYQKINNFGNSELSYIPCYEHGFGIKKNHQLCIGSSKVTWLDFPLYQTIHHKQTIINKLRSVNEIVAVAHPLFNNAYKPADFKYLTNYDLIEVLNHYVNSAECWDSALSSGHPVFIIADDDMHDLKGKDEFGVCGNYINSNETDKESIIASLKKGFSYGAEFTYSDNDDPEIKKERIKNIPYLKCFTIINDTLKVVLSGNAASFKFIGQNGKILKISKNSSSALYCLKPADSYLRTEIVLSDSSKIYLNPVFRYSGDDPLKKTVPHRNIFMSVLLKIIIIALWLIIIYFFAVKPYANSKR